MENLNLERKDGNHTFEVKLVIGNLQEHQLDALNQFLILLENNGGIVIKRQTEHD